MYENILVTREGRVATVVVNRPEKLNALSRGTLDELQDAFNALRSGAEYYSAEALADGMQRYNRALLGICRQRAVECLDVATQLPRTPEVFYDDAHFTDHGAALLAELVSDHVRTWVRSPRP